VSTCLGPIHQYEDAQFSEALLGTQEQSIVLPRVLYANSQKARDAITEGWLHLRNLDSLALCHLADDPAGMAGLGEQIKERIELSRGDGSQETS
jgi:ATP-dependent exoDNAse (exonuclease V) alpha subunit